MKSTERLRDVEFTWWRPLKGDSLPPKPSTFWLKPPLTFSPSVDSNVAECCSLLQSDWSYGTADMKAQGTEPTAGTPAPTETSIRLMLIRVPASLPAGWLIWSICAGFLAVKYLGQSEKDGAQLETARRKKWTKFFFPHSITLPSS